MRTNMIARLLLFSLAWFSMALAAKAVPPAAGPQSAAHPLAVPAWAQSPSQSTGQTAQTLPTSLVWQDGKRAFYSSAVNAISATATVGQQKWLATAMGLKQVDLLNHQVRHFTRLDGLPGDRIVAVAATSPNAVYCVSQTTQVGGFAWALCRFEAATGRWAVEQEVARPDYQAYRRSIPAGAAQPPRTTPALWYPSPEDAHAFLAIRQGAVYFAPDVSLTDTDPLLFVRNPRSSRWRGVTPSPTLRAGIGPVNVLSLHLADDGSAWLGTDHGLWHYAPAQDKWTTFLSTEVILLTAVHGDDVWAVEPVLPQITPGAAALLQPGPPGLIRLSTVTQMVQSWPFPARTSPLDGWATRPATLVVGEDGRVWTCEGDTTLGPGRRFCVFDPTTQQWQSIPADGPVSLASIPDAALPLPLPPNILVSPEYTRRFPDWFCPDEPGPTVPQDIGIGQTLWTDRDTGPRSEADRYQPIFAERNSHYPTQFADTGSVTWSLARNANGDYAVIRTGGTTADGRIGAREVYPWRGADIATNPAIYTAGYVGGVLLVTTENKDWAVSPVRGTWAITDLWRTQPGGGPRRIVPQGDHAWVGDGEAVVRYDPKTGLSKPRFQSKEPQPQVERSLLAVTGAGRLWLVAKNYHTLPWERLYRVEPGSETPVEVSLTLPLALRPTPRESQMYNNQTLEVTPLPTTPNPVAVSETSAGELVWCVGWMTLRGQQVVCLIGYNPSTRRWTTPQPAGWSEGDLHPITVGHKVYVPVPGGDAAVWGYDILTRQWEVAAGAFKAVSGFAADGLTLISVAPEAIWCLDSEMLRVCRYDRRTKAWSVFPCPVHYGGDARTDKVARVGDALFVASREGLWRFDMRGRTWRRLPVPDHERKIEFLVSDAKSLWGKTRQGVARFDKTTRLWTTFNRPDDSPERFISNDLAADGSGAWLYGNSPAYRLDLATGKWTDMTRGALPDPLLTLLVQDVVPDDRWVWLLPGDLRAQRNVGAEAAAPLLGRYDLVTGRMDWYGGPGHPATGELPAEQERLQRNQATMMLVEQDAVWVGTQDGVYRYDKAAQSLSRFQVPPQFPLPANFAPNTVVRDGDVLWLIGSAGRLRWVP